MGLIRHLSYEMKRLVIATFNPGKAREIAELLSGLPIEIVSLADYPAIPEPEESGSSFAENAIIKARDACECAGEMALADDSGLEVDALGGGLLEPTLPPAQEDQDGHRRGHGGQQKTAGDEAVANGVMRHAKLLVKLAAGKPAG